MNEDLKNKIDKPIISVVILNYNGENFLTECLYSLRQQSFKNFETILVDNASTDNSINSVRKNYPEVKIIVNGINEGTSGYNLGIKASKAPYVMLLNNDTMVDVNCLGIIARVIEEYNNVGMFALKIVFFDEPEILDSMGIAIYRDGTSKQNRHFCLDDPSMIEPFPALLPSGAGGIYSKKMLEDIGMFDPIFFAYCEDTDLGLRARLAGYECLCIPNAKVYHRISASWQAFPTRKAVLVERNRFWLVLRTFPLRYLMVTPFHTILRYIVMAKAGIKGIGHSGKFFHNHNLWSIILILLKLIYSSLIGIPQALSKRREIMAKRKISSRKFGELLQMFGISAKEIFLHPKDLIFEKNYSE